MPTALSDVHHILQVEDSEDDALLVQAQLRTIDRRLEFRRVETAEEMRAALAERDWDLVISDHRLPRFDAMRASDVLRRHRPEVPFIIMSGYLKRFPIDVLKIDRSFLERVTEDSDNQAIVRTIIALARSLKLEAVAEGVETNEQFKFLRGLGCERAQGFLLGRPVAADDAARCCERSRVKKSRVRLDF